MIERSNPLWTVIRITCNLEECSTFWIMLTVFPQTTNFRKSHNETCFQDPQSCAWLVIRSNQFGPKNPNQVHRHQKPTCRHATKGNFTRDEWNHLMCLFNISHFSSTVCSEGMAQRVQQDSGEERVTAKSRPMMSLIARAPSTLSSSASECPGKKSFESQSPWSAKAEKEDGTGRPVVDCHKQFIESSYSARYSRWDDDKAWSSQEWKADKSMDDRTGQPVVTSWWKTHESQSSFSHEKTKHVILEEEEPHDRTGQPVVYPQRETRPQQFIIGDDETDSELSLGSRSFLNRVNDQVRKRQKRSSMNVTENDEKHSMIWGMFMSVTLESAVFMGKNYSDNWHSIKKYRRSHNETDVRHICKISVWTRWDLWSGNNWLGQNGRCTIVIENSQIGMSRHLDSSTTTQMAQIMVQYGRPSRSSWKESVWRRRFPIGNAYAYTVKKGYSSLCMWMT